MSARKTVQWTVFSEMGPAGPWEQGTGIAAAARSDESIGAENMATAFPVSSAAVLRIPQYHRTLSCNVNSYSSASMSFGMFEAREQGQRAPEPSKPARSAGASDALKDLLRIEKCTRQPTTLIIRYFFKHTVTDKNEPSPCSG